MLAGNGALHLNGRRGVGNGTFKQLFVLTPRDHNSVQLVLYGSLFLQILHSLVSEADDLGLVPWLRVGGPRSCK